MTGRSYLVDQPRDPSRPWAPSPFARLARTHAMSVAGDAMFTTAMAGLVFFSVTKLDQARWQVAAALLFTIVPFSMAAPFIGPLIDRARGGRKWMIFVLCLLRALVALLLSLNRDNQLFMYPEFTLVLVFAQGYVLARGALVPATVRSDAELVKANSKLSAISGAGAVAGGATSLAVMWIVGKLDFDSGPSVALFLAAMCYLVASVEAFQLPSMQVAPDLPGEVETTELHAPGIRAAAIALSVVRLSVGFVTFLLAFHFKSLEEAEPWASKVGLVGCVVMAQVGFLTGSFVAPRVRQYVAEEQIVLFSLSAMAVAALLTSVMSDLAGAMLLALALGLSSNSAKQAFDSIVQRDAPDANRGRAFARFETRFQLFWVIGALLPVVIRLPPHSGFVAVGLACLAGAVWFFVTRRRLIAEGRRRPSPHGGEPVLVEPRPISRAFLRHRRGTGSAGADDLDPLPFGVDPTMVLSDVGGAGYGSNHFPTDDEPTLVQGPAGAMGAGGRGAAGSPWPSPPVPPPFIGGVYDGSVYDVPRPAGPVDPADFERTIVGEHLFAGPPGGETHQAGAGAGARSNEAAPWPSTAAIPVVESHETRSGPAPPPVDPYLPAAPGTPLIATAPIPLPGPGAIPAGPGSDPAAVPLDPIVDDWARPHDWPEPPPPPATPRSLRRDRAGAVPPDAGLPGETGRRSRPTRRSTRTSPTWAPPAADDDDFGFASEAALFHQRDDQRDERDQRDQRNATDAGASGSGCDPDPAF